MGKRRMMGSATSSYSYDNLYSPQMVAEQQRKITTTA